jgi:adenylate kinase family enzyme
MARKCGKKNTISENPLEYAYGLFGEGGSGKTTLAKDFCEKLGGDECYLHLNIGDESGVDAISDIVSEDVETWDKFVEIVDDIV